MKKFRLFSELEPNSNYNQRYYYRVKSPGLDRLCASASLDFSNYKRTKDMEMFQSALKRYLNAYFEVNTQLEPVMDEAYCLRRAASVAMRCYDAEKALEYMHRAEKYLIEAKRIAETLNFSMMSYIEKVEYIRTLAMLGDVCMETMNGTMLEDVADKLVSYCDVDSNKEYLHDAHLYRYHIAMARDDIKKAEAAIDSAEKIIDLPVHHRHRAVVDLVKATRTCNSNDKFKLIKSAKSHLWKSYDVNKKALAEARKGADAQTNNNSNKPNTKIHYNLQKRVMNDILLLFKIRAVQYDAKSALNNIKKEAEAHLDEFFQKKCNYHARQMLQAVSNNESVQLVYPLFEKKLPANISFKPSN